MRKTLIGSRKSTGARVAGSAPNVRASRVRSAPRQGIVAEGVEATAEEIVREAYEGTAIAYNEEIVPWFESIRRAWPVHTGFSRDALELEQRIVGTRVVASIRNLASYAGYIRQGKYRVPNAVKRLVWDPSERVARALAERVGKYLAD